MSNSKLISNNTRLHVPHFYFDCHLRVLDIGFGNFLLIFFFFTRRFYPKGHFYYFNSGVFQTGGLPR